MSPGILSWHSEGVNQPPDRTVIIDRDGVINRRLEQSVRTWSDFEFLPGSPEGVAMLSRAGFRVVVVTNQANVGRGILDAAVLEEIHDRMLESLAATGGEVAGIYVCPHRPDEGCDCRKPRPGLLLRAASELGFDLRRTWAIGDSPGDVEAAVVAGAMPLIVLSGITSAADIPPGTEHAESDLLAAARWLTARQD
jgi:D-glycero-D-manno-heptose 1,7-bisphosphate phosphatase